MNMPTEQRPDRLEGRTRRYRFGLRFLLVLVLLIGLLLGGATRFYHQTSHRGRLLAELSGMGVGALQYKQTPLGWMTRLLPSRWNDHLHSAFGDRMFNLVAEPSVMSLVLIDKRRLSDALSRLRGLSGVQTLRVPKGMGEAEMDLIHEALPGVRFEVDPRYDYGRFHVIVNGPAAF